jgi:hypothetical protein
LGSIAFNVVAHEVMQRDAGVLRCALDQPVERQPLVDLVAQAFVFVGTIGAVGAIGRRIRGGGGHRSPCALGSGIGRVLGQSGLKGSG